MNEVAEATSPEVAAGAAAHVERKLTFAFAKRHGVLVMSHSSDHVSQIGPAASVFGIQF